MKALQRFSDEYLARCAEMSPEEIVQFLDDFRHIHGTQPPTSKTRSKLISIKIPQDLLASFRVKTALMDTPYQTQIKRLMIEWLKET